MRDVSASGRIDAESALVAYSPDRPGIEVCAVSVPDRSNGAREDATLPQARRASRQPRGDAHPGSILASDLLTKEAIGNGCEQVLPPAGTDARQLARRRNRRRSFALSAPRHQSSSRPLADGPSARRTRRAAARRQATPNAVLSGQPAADGSNQASALLNGIAANDSQGVRFGDSQSTLRSVLLSVRSHASLPFDVICAIESSSDDDDAIVVRRRSSKNLGAHI